MQRFWGRGAGWALPLVWGVAFAAPVSATDVDEAAAPTVAEEGEPLPPVQPPVIQVDEVSVTAARAERAVLDQPGNITILTREDILESGVTTVPELLRREAGIFVTNKAGSTPTDVNVEVRGFNNGGGNGSSTLVLIDGRRANLPQSGSADWALIRIDDIDRIEIVRGPASAVYGDNAVGGVIEIFTRRVEESLQAEITARGGSYATAQGSLFAGGGTGDFAGSVFLNGYTSDGYRDFSNFRNKKAKGNLRYSPGERLMIVLEGGYSTDRRKFPGALLRADVQSEGRRSRDPDLFESFYDVQDSFAQVSVEGEVADDIVLTLQPSWRTWDQQSADGRTVKGFCADPDVIGDAFYTQESETSSIAVNGQLEISRAIGPFENRMTIGGDWLYETDKRSDAYAATNPDCDSATTGSNRRYIASGYLQEEVEILEGLLVSGGVRYDYARYDVRSVGTFGDSDRRDHYGIWSPKAAVTYRIFEPASVYFSYSRGLRFPNFDEIYPFSFGSPPAPLDPEISTSYEVGAKYRQREVQAGISFYWMDVENEIFFFPDSSHPDAYGNRNFDEVRHRGIELSVGYRPFDWVQVYASYTFDNTEIREFTLDPAVVGKQMPITPESRGAVGVNFFVPFQPLDVVEFGVNANIVGPRYAANDLLNEFVPLSTYGTVDLHGRIEKKFWNLFDLALFFDLRNLGDESYSENATYSYSDREVGFYPSPGRNFEIGLSIGFKR